MARPRKTAPAGSRAKRNTARTSDSQFVCPECGRTFSRAAALGAHRRSHGVAGATTRKNNGAAPQRGRPPRRSARATGSTDRDVLLAALFPNGVPPRVEVIRAASLWLDEA